MKKVLFIILVLLVLLMLVTVSFASEIATEINTENDKLREYVEEKIVPVLMGVITSVVALLSTLKGIFSSLRGLKESKENFDKDRESIKEENKKELAKITEKYEEIKNEVKTVCLLTTEIEKLKGQAEILSQEIVNLSQIASLGFSKNQKLVKEGNARKIVVLAEKSKEILDSETV